MRLSIFIDAKAHPKNKEEKQREALKLSNPYVPQTVTVTDENHLIQLITHHAWSPFVFSGYRHSDNFVSCDFLVYDIDEGLTIDEADTILSSNNFCYLILPSPSHTETNHRFRIIIPLAHSILDLETYEETWKTGADILKFVDKQCSDPCRGYFGSRDDDGFSDFSKDFFVPVKKKSSSTDLRGYGHSTTEMMPVTEDIAEIVKYLYGEERTKVPEAVDFFLKNAHTGLPGEWTNSLNAAVFSLTLSEVPEDRIVEVLEKIAPNGGLDKNDLYQINRAIRDGKKAI